MQGLDHVLCSLMGLRLRVMPHTSHPAVQTVASTVMSSTSSNTGSTKYSTGSTPSSTGGGTGAATRPCGATAHTHAALWGSSVVALQLDDLATGATGMVFLDPGSGYGTRQLRFSRAWGAAPSPPFPAPNFPAVGSDATAATAGAAGASPASPKMSAPLQDSGGQLQRTEEQQAGTTFATSAAGCGDNEPRPQLPLVVVSCGLAWSWQDGKAGAPEAIWELLHELGHAVHLVLSSAHAPFKLFGGLHLPLDVLEVPSMLFEKLLLHPDTLAHICGQPVASRGAQLQMGTSYPGAAASQAQHSFPSQLDVGSHRPECSAPVPASKPAPAHRPLDPVTAQQLAAHFHARHYGALDFQEQLLVALSDQLLNMTPMRELRSSHVAAVATEYVWETHSSIPHAPVTLKRVSAG